MNETAPTAVLLITCPDRPGIVSAVTRFVSTRGGNILHLDQHVDFERGILFMRLEWTLAAFTVPRDRILEDLDPIVREFHLTPQLRFSDQAPRMAIFVSRESHCLYDMLARYESEEWQVEIPLIVSNHSGLGAVAEQFGIDFEVVRITPENKAAQELVELSLLKKYRIDFIVLARYMQILSGDFIRHYPHRIINIHHSFLPAFAGAKPYHSAYARGVKIIGATSHYVTEDLDAGPIIEQDIIRVSHKDPVEELIRRGRDLEKMVLARAIWWHLQNKILVYDNKTIIFD